MPNGNTARKLEVDYKVRQERHVLQDLRLTLQVAGNDFAVENFSYFGLGIITEPKTVANLFTSETTKAKLMLEGEVIQVVSLSIARSENRADKKLLGLKIHGPALDVDRLFFVADGIRQLKELQVLEHKYDDLPQQVKFEVLSLRSTLEKFQERINQLERARVFSSMAQKEAFEEAIVRILATAINEKIVLTNKSLQQHFLKMPTEQRGLGFEFFRDQLKHLIYESVFADRSYRKPRGYAGDFEMMNLIYRNDATGKNLFGRVIEGAMQLHPEPGAVRNRATFLKERILQTLEILPGQVSILSVASGPAFEVQNTLDEINPEDAKRLRVTLLDQDEEALRNAQRCIKEKCNKRGFDVPVTLLNTNLRNVINEGLPVTEKFQLIYSAGLFDYFTDPVAQRACSALWKGVAENGRLIIGNFDANTPNQFGMLSLFDWHLILRSEEQLKQLYDFEDAKTNVEAEENGINLFAVLEKNK